MLHLRSSLRNSPGGNKFVRVRRRTLSRPEHLPDFSKPPIDEVSIGFQFKTLRKLLSAHYGIFHEKIKDRFPIIEEHSPLRTTFETFGRTAEQPPSIEFGTTPPLRRVWFLSKDGHNLIQLQPNRFIHNWRKIEGEGDYPRFENILPDLFATFEKFQEFLIEINIDSLDVTQCELSYFNNIDLLNDETFGEAFERVFCFWEEKGFNGRLLESRLERESVAVHRTFRVFEPEGNEPIARLHIEALPAYQPEVGEEVIRLQLTFRGQPKSLEPGALERFFLIGREAIVEMFSAFTTTESHLLWGRRDNQDEGP